MLNDKIQVVRSPAKVAWWVVYEDTTLAVCETRREAQQVRDELLSKF